MVGPEGLDVVAVVLLLRGELQLKLILEPLQLVLKGLLLLHLLLLHGVLLELDVLLMRAGLLHHGLLQLSDGGERIARARRGTWAGVERLDRRGLERCGAHRGSKGTVRSHRGAKSRTPGGHERRLHVKPDGRGGRKIGGGDGGLQWAVCGLAGDRGGGGGGSEPGAAGVLEIGIAHMHVWVGWIRCPAGSPCTGASHAG